MKNYALSVLCIIQIIKIPGEWNYEMSEIII